MAGGEQPLRDRSHTPHTNAERVQRLRERAQRVEQPVRGVLMGLIDLIADNLDPDE